MSEDGEGSLKDRLTAFYKLHNPDKLSTVEATVKKYEGKETDLWKDLNKKYEKRSSAMMVWSFEEKHVNKLNTRMEDGTLSCVLRRSEVVLIST